MIFMAIDPGMSGGICFMQVEGAFREVLFAAELPVCDDGSNRQIDVPVLCDWIEKYDPAHAVIENVQPMPSIPGADGARRSMGATSAFRFGMAIGQLRAVVQVYEVPIRLVVPRVWKKHFGLIGPNKEQSRQLAISLLPGAAHFLTLKKHHGRAEAMLLALYVTDKMGMV